jgi:hypothetical protein
MGGTRFSVRYRRLKGLSEHNRFRSMPFAIVMALPEANCGDVTSARRPGRPYGDTGPRLEAGHSFDARSGGPIAPSQLFETYLLWFVAELSMTWMTDPFINESCPD